MSTTKRKSQTIIGNIYFWTATIYNWNCLLASDDFKDLIVNYLKKMSDEGLITIFGFVIMPNHIHMIFRQNRLNGKESPKASLLKFTAHAFLKCLKATGQEYLYKVTRTNKAYEIWQRDSLGIEIYSKWVARQKLEYMHANPVKGKWKLSKDDVSYYYSSARFYETGIDEFGFLNNLYFEFDG